MAPEKNTTDKMKTMPATMTTHAAATYSLGGLTDSGGNGGGGGPTRGGGGGGGGAAAEVGWVEDSGVSLMHCILPPSPTMQQAPDDKVAVN
jgi:hypothetical protein